MISEGNCTRQQYNYIICCWVQSLPLYIKVTLVYKLWSLLNIQIIYVTLNIFQPHHNPHPHPAPAPRPIPTHPIPSHPHAPMTFCCPGKSGLACDSYFPLNLVHLWLYSCYSYCHKNNNVSSCNKVAKWPLMVRPEDIWNIQIRDLDHGFDNRFR